VGGRGKGKKDKRNWQRTNPENANFGGGKNGVSRKQDVGKEVESLPELKSRMLGKRVSKKPCMCSDWGAGGS